MNKGLLEKIKLTNGRTAVFYFRSSAVEDLAGDLTRNKLVTDPKPGVQNLAYKRISGQFNWFSMKLKEFRDRLFLEDVNGLIGKVRNESNTDSLKAGIAKALLTTRLYLADVEDVISNLGSSRLGFNTDSLPGDTAAVYQERFDNLFDALNVLKSTYVQYSITLNALETRTEPGLLSGNPDSVRRTIRNSFESIFARHRDSLRSIINGEEALRLEILPIIREDLSLLVNGRTLDSLMSVHSALETVFLSLKLSHEQVWTNYRNAITGYRPVNEIEALNRSFIDLQNEAEGKFLDTKTKVQGAQTRALRNPEILSRIFIWAGIAAAVLILLAFLFRFLKPALWRYTGRVAQPSRGGDIPNIIQPVANQVNGGSVGDALPDEYYTLDYLQLLPDVMIGRIHLSASAIQSVYQLVHGAFLGKQAGNYGGYLFGSHYKLKSDGSVKHEIIIDKVAGSEWIRFGIANNMESRAEVVDEIEKNIQQNKKYQLLGWFTSSTDPSMDMPEGLQKIHRTFFKENYHLAILINPGSEDLKSACFLRRKSGFFDPIPDPAAFINWEALYRFSLNPVKSPVVKHPASKADVNYTALSINSSWCDSIVSKLNFTPDVVEEISHACDLQASPQESYQVVGYLYGSSTAGEGKSGEAEVFVERFVELSNEAAPRGIPGFSLVGWWGQGRSEVFNSIIPAINYHEQFFREPYQVACLMNSVSGELRVFSRKHDLSMNNNIIETEEFDFKSLKINGPLPDPSV
jgi:hypothetical protein